MLGRQANSVPQILFVLAIACGNLVPQPGIEPLPAAMEAQSLNHRAAREVSPPPFLLIAPTIAVRSYNNNLCVLVKDDTPKPFSKRPVP